jgi:hypothetical protein
MPDDKPQRQPTTLISLRRTVLIQKKTLTPNPPHHSPLPSSPSDYLPPDSRHHSRCRNSPHCPRRIFRRVSGGLGARAVVCCLLLLARLVEVVVGLVLWSMSLRVDLSSGRSLLMLWWVRQRVCLRRRNPSRLLRSRLLLLRLFPYVSQCLIGLLCTPSAQSRRTTDIQTKER